MKNEQLSCRQTPWGEELYCKRCGSDVLWQECEQCEEGYSYHDCGEDTCCCLDPQPNVVCDVCNGEGRWHVCLGCNRPTEYCSCEKEKEVGLNG